MPASNPILEGKNLCDPVKDYRGVTHAFAHAVPWYDNMTTMAYACWCRWEGRKTDFDAHMAAAYEKPFAIDQSTGYPKEYEDAESN